MNRVLFLVGCPTPQRTPTLDRLAQLPGIDVRVLYGSLSDTGRGWGQVIPKHWSRVLPPQRLRALRVMFEEVHQNEVAAVASFGYASLTHAGLILAARRRRLPVAIRTDANIADEHERPWPRRLLKKLLLRALIGKRAVVWTIGSANEALWREYGFKNLERIPYTVPDAPTATANEGAHFRASVGLPSDAVVLLFVGRLSPEKGLEDLLDAFAGLEKRDLRLVIVGGGPQDRLVRARAARDVRIVSLGPIEYTRLGPIYASADAVVVPSRKEPWGLVVNEALANGCLVVASDRVASADDTVGDLVRFGAGDVTALRDALATVPRRDNTASGVLPPDTAAAMADSLRSMMRHAHSA